MKFFVWAFTALLVVGHSAFADQTVTVDDFIKMFQGSYAVDSINQAPPEANNATGTVSLAGSDKGILSFSYCQPSGVCDPGFNALPFATTTISESRTVDNHELYDIQATNNGKSTHYTWENDDGKITFQHFNYKLTDGTVITLEHVAHKTGN